jgi:hypothetical protein
MAHTRSCGRLTVATFLALLLMTKVANLAQRLDAWCLDASAKAGHNRPRLEGTPCCVPLRRWSVRLWQGTHLARTVDATTLSDRFVVLVVCVVDRGSGIPVAWTILPAGRNQAGRRAWWRRLRLLRPASPAPWTVLVLADRG